MLAATAALRLLCGRLVAPIAILKAAARQAAAYTKNGRSPFKTLRLPFQLLEEILAVQVGGPGTILPGAGKVDDRRAVI